MPLNNGALVDLQICSLSLFGAEVPKGGVNRMEARALKKINKLFQKLVLIIDLILSRTN